MPRSTTGISRLPDCALAQWHFRALGWVADCSSAPDRKFHTTRSGTCDPVSGRATRQDHCQRVVPRRADLLRDLVGKDGSFHRKRRAPELVTISRKKCAEEERYDILIAADEPQIENAAHDLMQHGTDVRAIQADLAGAR
jgi:hypothetical protein